LPIQNDDYSDNSNTQGYISVNGSTSGEIEEVGDQDWFAINMVAGHTYQIDLEGASTSSGSLSDTYLQGIYDSSSSLIVDTSNDDGGTGLNSQLQFSAGSTDTYYISAGAFSSASGTYSLFVSDLGGPDDYSSNISTYGNLTINSTIRGEIEESLDQDWFKVNLSGGQTYLINLEGSPTYSGSLGDTYLAGIFDSSGQFIIDTTNDDGGTVLNSQLEFIAPTSGTYYISASAYGSGTGTYSLSINSITQYDDYSSSSNRAGYIQINGATRGNIETAEDTDWFAANLIAGRIYDISLEGAPTNAGTLSDTYIRGVYRSNGDLIENTSNDDSGADTNSTVEFIPNSTGIYYISAGAYGSNTGSYKLALTNSGSLSTDDYSNNTGSFGQISVNSFQSGTIEQANDQDWFAVTLESDHKYQIGLLGEGTFNGTLSDPYFQGIYNASGNLIPDTINDDGGEGYNSYIEFIPNSSGTYYLSAGAYGIDIGSYNLTLIDTVSTNVTDDYGETVTSAGTVYVGGAAKTGDIEASGDKDWFAITMTSGSTYKIDLEGNPTNNGSLSDTFLSGIYTRNGNLISNSSDDDGGIGTNSSLFFTPESTGIHYISASAYSNHTGSYRLIVTETTPEPAQSDSFNIQINYTGDSIYQHLFDSAAERWEQIIITDIPDMQTNTYGLIDDLLIDASINYIDGPGHTLAQAGADLLRPDSQIPSHGVMFFDSSDITSMEEKGTLEDVILHEMGHVLGFSSFFFNRLGLSSDFSYSGENAVSAYRVLINDPSVSYVPLETAGGQGTAGSHWSESVFDAELMTGYVEEYPLMPISIVTIGALEDIGYTVDYSQADHYTLSNNLLLPSVLLNNEENEGLIYRSNLEDNFSGSIFNYYEEKPLSLSLDTIADKLEGTVLVANKTSISFIDSNTNYRIQLEGNFTKDSPAITQNVKGTVGAITLSDGLGIISSLKYATPTPISSVLNNWINSQLEGDNFININTFTPQNDYINTGAGNDTIIAGSGNDTIDGGIDIDTVFYNQSFNNYTVAVTGTALDITFAIDESIDSLSNIERLNFSDVNLAFDINGHAGITAKILGATFGSESVSNPTYVSVGLNSLDDGMSYETLLGYAISAAGARTSEEIVNLLWENVVGSLPNDYWSSFFVERLDNGTYTPSSFGMLATEHELNIENIDLVGLTLTGVEFI